MPPHMWTDEERVIAGLKSCGGVSLGKCWCIGCPYAGYDRKYCKDALHADALALITGESHMDDDLK